MGGKKVKYLINAHCTVTAYCGLIKISDKPASLFTLFPGSNSKSAESWPTACALLKCHSHPEDRDSKMYRQCAGLLKRDGFHPSKSPFRTRDWDASYLCWH